MTDLKALQSQGWFVSEESLKEITESLDKVTPQSINKYLLDNDIKDYGSGWIADKGKSADSLKGCGVVQVTRIRNVAAPSYDEHNQAAPQLLRVHLSDGKTNLSILDMSGVFHLDRTIPGTKVRLQGGMPIQLGFVLVSPQNVQILGGNVEALAAAWTLKKSMLKHNRVLHKEGGPPPFVPFGSKIKPLETPKVKGSRFRAMDTVLGVEDPGDAEANTDFTDKRQAVIAEAQQMARVAEGKQFVASESKFAQREREKAEQSMAQDRNITNLVSMGFMARDAADALKKTNGNFERALESLLSRDMSAASLRSASPESEGRRGGGRGRGRGRGGKRGGRRGSDDDGDPNIDTGPVARPSGPSTLADFFGAKITPSGGGGDAGKEGSDRMLKPGMQCEAKGMDGKYQRVRINHVQGDGLINLVYLETNAVESVPVNLMRTLDGQKIPPQQPTNAASGNRQSNQTRQADNTRYPSSRGRGGRRDGDDQSRYPDSRGRGRHDNSESRGRGRHDNSESRSRGSYDNNESRRRGGYDNNDSRRRDGYDNNDSRGRGRYNNNESRGRGGYDNSDSRRRGDHDNSESRGRGDYDNNEPRGRGGNDSNESRNRGGFANNERGGRRGYDNNSQTHVVSINESIGRGRYGNEPRGQDRYENSDQRGHGRYDNGSSSGRRLDNYGQSDRAYNNSSSEFRGYGESFEFRGVDKPYVEEYDTEEPAHNNQYSSRSRDYEEYTNRHSHNTYNSRNNPNDYAYSQYQEPNGSSYDDYVGSFEGVSFQRGGGGRGYRGERRR